MQLPRRIAGASVRLGGLVGRAGGRVGRLASQAAQAQGAGTTGLSRLIELQALNAAGDAAVAVSLAGTLFFQVPTDEARGQVALFLAITMLPFAIVAPLIGPLLDRFSHGRRWAIGATTAGRAFLCWVLAGAVATESPSMFAAALGCLVASKAYAVTRASAVPRLMPDGLTLVQANGRVLLAGMIGAALSAAVAGVLSLIGPEWSLRYGFVVFVLATIWAIRLPERVDSSAGEQDLFEQEGGRPRGLRGLPPLVSLALRANCAPRWISGFLTIFLAFLIREVDFGDVRPDLVLAMVVGAAGLGNALGITFGSVGRSLPPAAVVLGAAIADAVACVVAALVGGIWPLVVLGLVAGLAQSMAKLALDSTIQVEVPEVVRTSALARSDTTLQLAWVLGGLTAIVVPSWRSGGPAIAAFVVALWLVVAILLPRSRSGSGSSTPHPESDAQPA